MLSQTEKIELLLVGAMKRIGTNDETLGWMEVTKELDHLRAEEGKGFYVNDKPLEKKLSHSLPPL